MVVGPSPPEQAARASWIGAEMASLRPDGPSPREQAARARARATSKGTVSIPTGLIDFPLNANTNGTGNVVLPPNIVLWIEIQRPRDDSQILVATPRQADEDDPIGRQVLRQMSRAIDGMGRL